MSKRVLVAVSGGVDSAVCVHLLQKQGYEVGGIVLKMSPAHEETVAAAADVAASLHIPLIVRDETERFGREVVDYFTDAYRRGQTPNPCTRCNPTVKFKALLEAADEEGYDLIATGHYAGLTRMPDGEVRLRRAQCLKRDQSYMLYGLGQEVLSRLLLPLEALEKSEVRAIAEALGLAAAKKPDSQEICFIPENDYAGYIEARFGRMPEGDFIAPSGAVCGRHRGLCRYTVGQRKKLGIALGEPVFITRIDPVENRIYLARSGEDRITKVFLSGLTTPSGKPLPAHFTARVKLRSAAEPVEAEVFCRGGEAELLLKESFRVVAPGQAAVLYDGEFLLGGGTIERGE